jgi:hypothetical protein
MATTTWRVNSKNQEYKGGRAPQREGWALGGEDYNAVDLQYNMRDEYNNILYMDENQHYGWCWEENYGDGGNVLVLVIHHCGRYVWPFLHLKQQRDGELLESRWT